MKLTLQTQLVLSPEVHQSPRHDQQSLCFPLKIHKLQPGSEAKHDLKEKTLSWAKPRPVKLQMQHNSIPSLLSQPFFCVFFNSLSVCLVRVELIHKTTPTTPHIRSCWIVYIERKSRTPFSNTKTIELRKHFESWALPQFMMFSLKTQWQPFWLAIQLHSQNDWAGGGGGGGGFCVHYDVFT